MHTPTATVGHYTTEPVLYLAFELSDKSWQLGSTIGMGQQPRRRSVPAGDLEAVDKEIALAKKRFGLAADSRVVSCYEAGRDGFWLDRYLRAAGVDNRVVDSASIQVDRRSRRVKTDRIDVDKLLAMLVRYHGGERWVWRLVRVPTEAEEDWRHMHRELEALKKDRIRLINRIKGLLVTQGLRLSITPDFPVELTAARTWKGTPLPGHLQARLQRHFQHLRFIEDQIDRLKAQRLEAVRTSSEPCIEQVRRLLMLRGIGMESAWLFVMEFFSWRRFRNRREVGALAGLTPTPYASGASCREQGISKAGNRRVRTMAIEIAWSWLRYQPDSELSRWFQERYGQGSSRQRRVGIVALARKLLIAFWRYLDMGLVPTGATLKTRLPF